MAAVLGVVDALILYSPRIIKNLTAYNNYIIRNKLIFYSSAYNGDGGTLGQMANWKITTLGSYLFS